MSASVSTVHLYSVAKNSDACNYLLQVEGEQSRYDRFGLGQRHDDPERLRRLPRRLVMEQRRRQTDEQRGHGLEPQGVSVGLVTGSKYCDL